jgi:hypothetical protein
MRKALVRSPRLLLLAAAIIVSSAVYMGCGTDNNVTAPVESGRSQGAVSLEMSNPRVQAVMAVQDRHTPELMADNNVVGTATGLSADGSEVVIKVYLREAASTQRIAESIEGIRVETEVVGTIKAMKSGGGGVSHTGIQSLPIQLGTSGGWRYDLANGYCCGGTLGSLVQIGGNQYILSNYHVLRADIVNGGNSRVAQIGDPVIQPALIDVGCNANNAQNVATLAGSASLPGSNVDAALAAVNPGAVSSSILEIGTISSSTVGASLNQAVKKSGRTTGLTRSSISGLNANVQIAYENECAGGAAFTKTFTGQIFINNKGSRFLAGGDSGSLMVEDVTSNARAVGLLYAGSSSIAVANPIGHVLSYFNATMVGN